ncbi:asparagine synthase (glutamine-hydrolyzing) [Micavibrio aeruginosavorus]|uniref:asparagine synthase (glutamine-hydrolyzing) n=1 Tax=Micavibrio aeruginosavorus EPB TaxID=349215 RepID=M4VEZ2_9BACT|nr:asparagine synthase (glutamine-hydrolyzing) [Micavibrio aeruginosavorus]AGH97798.1 Asparagine synthetase [glutamine-hydrolyzing] [Micavibrio aeruginosavorus EPB]
MCGISGFISSRSVPENSLRNMNNIIRHRGPDGEGFVLFTESVEMPLVLSGADTPNFTAENRPSWFPDNSEQAFPNDAYVGFGHRRLSILDLSPLGHQPMSYAEGRYWITYNGEVYNYLELRAELENLGHKFVSRTDTEVILAAYAEWGKDCLEKFNGMWAFAIFDRRENKVFLARDRFGVKPLYYWVAPDNNFYFGSEIKQFTVIPGWNAIVNVQRAYDFLVWGITDHTEETLFQRVFHIRPGHSAEINISDGVSHSNGRIYTTKWYDIPENKFSGSMDKAATDFYNLLKQSVELRLRSDVAVGSCLSGGLDSSSIVCLMKDILREAGANNAQKTFSALSKVDKFNEQKWIEAVVCHAQTDSHYTCPEMSDLFDVSNTITWHQDEPFGSTSIFAQWNVFKLAAEDEARVMLDGQGADEQLFGYHGAMGVRFGTLFRTMRWGQLFREFVLVHNIHGYPYKTLVGQFAASVLPQSIQSVLRRAMGKTTPVPAWLNWNVLPAKVVSPFRGAEKSVYDYCHAQMTSTNLQMLLHWEDRDSMAHSIESRVPFLDYRVVEFSMALPDDYKIKDGVTKRILRLAMDGVIPDEIRDRMDKIGFATPEEVWVRETAPDVFRQKMKEAIDNSQGILNSNCVDLLEDIIAGRKPFSFVIWRMINFGEWMKLFSVRVGV